jgi:hypothetical protein
LSNDVHIRAIWATHRPVIVTVMQEKMRSLVLAVVPAGGQGAARRNAWAAMAADAKRARQRAEVTAYLNAVAAVHATPAAAVAASQA